MLDAFLQAQLDATEFLNENPLEAAEIVAEGSGLPAGGRLPLQRPRRHRQLRHHAQAVADRGAQGDVPVPEVDRRLRRPGHRRLRRRHRIRKAFAERGQDYDAALKSTTNPSALRGQDPVCNVAVTDPKLAGELWINGKDATQPAANPGCLLRAVREANADGEQVRAAYVPDTEIGTRWFADKSVWVHDGEQLPALRHRSPARSATSAPTPARRSSTTSRRWRGRRDAAPRGADGRRARGRRAGGTGSRRAHGAAWRSWLVRIASVAAAVALWQVLTANDVRLWLRFDTLPTVTEIVARSAHRLGTAGLLAGPRPVA